MVAGFEKFISRVDGPVYIVTAAVEGERAGCLVGFACQSSIDPPRFVVWISKQNHTYQLARRANLLAVHLLPRDHALAELFGGQTGDEVDKFSLVPHQDGPGGVPVLTEAVAWFAGHVEDHADWGDHVGFLLAPVDGDAVARGRPLSLTDVADIEAGHPA
ncbi:flavin reductase family protein [Streptacidiphilus cavernicola]|uniref:Flavin reductase family protein n=1 Tax=Streptacidiphilus cavernicola TaxID=3342716 RepID=A0ABV6VQ54_9ACTN